MLDVGKLKQQLIVSGKVAPEAIDAAEQHARKTGLSLTRTLAQSQVVSYDDLGACCSKVAGLPYLRLAGTAPAPEAAALISAPCAKAWMACPVSYTSSDQRLTLAVHDPDAIGMIEDIFRFFMQPWKLSFTVASDAEITEALASYPEPEQSAADSGKGVVRMRSREDPERRRRWRHVAEVGSREMAERLPGRAGSMPMPDSPADWSYENMGRALVNAMALLVRTKLTGDFKQMSNVASCVRYCQLMAVRLGLDAFRRDALLIGAWLCGLEDKHSLLKEIVSPYRLEELFAAEGAPESENRTERWILDLVRCYRDLQRDNPDISRDINLTRRELRIQWSSALERQEMLETFLQVLVDEEFLVGVDKAVGCVMVVDPAEARMCAIAPSLRQVGLEVVTVPDVSAAQQRLSDVIPDMIVIDMGAADNAGMRFCTHLKNSRATARIPILALVDENNAKLAVRSLRSGADDFIATPVNTELLFLKVQRWLAATRSGDAEWGVSGPLNEMGFTDMVQILSAGRKDLEVVLRAGESEGRVYMKQGEIIHAYVGDLEGEDAFYEFMRWTQGEFTTRHCPHFPERTIDSSTMSLLMEGARRADETQEQD